jgi:DHA2 family multidrug resistance protein
VSATAASPAGTAAAAPAGSGALIATVVTANIMQAIDLTITNIALSTIAGQLGATLNEAAWLLTAYVVGAAIGLPPTAYLNDRLGRRTLFIAAVAGFGAASLFCGLATSLEALALARFLQGLFSAPIAPIGNAVFAATFAKDRLAKVLSYYNMSMLVVPILGPAFGGFVTEVFGWRWLFLMNLPVGVLVIALALRVMPQTAVQDRRMDFAGFVTLAAVLVSMQLVIDHGYERGLDSPFVIACACVLAAGVATLVVHYASRPAAPLVRLTPLADPNFTLGVAAWVPFSIALWGGQLLQPFLFQRQFGHTAVETGLLLMPRALGAFASMFLYSRISQRFGASTFMLAGAAIATASCLWMTQMSPEMTGQWMMAPLAGQGVGMGLVITPLTVLAYSTVPKERMADAATLYYLARTASSAAGIGLMSMYAQRGFDRYWAEMRTQVDAASRAAAEYLSPLGLAADSAAGASLLAAEVTRQANMAAFIDGHWLAAAATALLIPVAMVLRVGARAPNGTH